MTSTAPADMIPAADVPNDALAKCDHIAYQHTALIQPHSVFIIVQPESREILQLSSNAAQFTAREPEDLLGKPFDASILPGISAVFEPERLSSFNDRPTIIDNVCDRHGNALVGLVHRRDDRLLIELEPESHPADLVFPQPESVVAAVGTAVSGDHPVEGIAAKLAEVMRELTNYDRCMVYRFDPEWNGEVIGESRAEHTEDSFLGLRFPSRDVPKSARKMFASSPARVTIDQLADCATLIPRKDPHTGADVDLTLVRARGAAGSCKTYYQNMGVRSTLIIPLFVSGKLWGLLSSHHNSVLRPGPRLDPYFATIGRLASNAIERAVSREVADATHQAAKVHEFLIKKHPTDPKWIDHLREQIGTLRSLLDCGGFILSTGDQVFTDGAVPSTERMPAFLRAMIERAGGEAISTNQVPIEHPDLRDLTNVAAGAIVIPLASGPRDVAIWVRPERRQTVRWAGDPRAGLKWNEQGRPELNPRDSFEVWKNSTANTCRQWTTSERVIAESASVHLGLMVLSWQASQASRSKTEFLANMSHEIRTPMNAILGFADMLLEDEEDREKRDALDIVKRNGKHLLGLIDDILDLAKVEAGKLTLSYEQIDPIHLVEEVCAALRPKAAAKGLALGVESVGWLPQSIITDPTRLQQVITNLVANAIKFTEQGRITVHVRTGRFNTEHEQIEFAVQDTGVGMNAEQQSRVFESFQQGDAGMSRRHGGSGLGLTISKRLVSLMGGAMTVQSEPNAGTTVSVRIRLRTSGSDEPRQPTQDEKRHAAINPRKTSTSLADKRILVVEDGPDNQVLITRLLRSAGASVEMAADGQIAIDIVNAQREDEAFDIILMDMQMPVLDGYEATRQLRTNNYQRPILALTAHAMIGDRERCLEAGCDDYLTKPIDRLTLIDACLKWSTPGHVAAGAPTEDANQENP